MQKCTIELRHSLAILVVAAFTLSLDAYSQILTSYPNQLQAEPITTLTPLATTTFSSSSSSCPIPTLSVSGFAASGDNWANFNNRLSSASTGAGNYGVTAAFSMPFPGELAKQCKENLAAYVRSVKLTSTANLVAACATLKVANINLRSDDFRRNFPEMDICQYVSATPPSEAGKGLSSPSPEGKINREDLPKNPFTFGPQQIPLIQTLPLQNR